MRLCARNAISHTAEEAIVPFWGLKQKPREYFADCLPGARGSKSPLGGEYETLAKELIRDRATTQVRKVLAVF